MQEPWQNGYRRRDLGFDCVESQVNVVYVHEKVDKKDLITYCSVQAADQMALANPKELMNIQLEYLLETANDSTIWGAWGRHYKPFEMEYKDYMTASVENNKDYTAENLAYVFCTYYERPQSTTKKELEERAASAEKWYSTFCGGEGE